MVRVVVIILLYLSWLHSAPLGTLLRSTPNETPFDSVTTQWSNPGDNDHITVNLGFSFSFNGINYTQVRISSNGVLSFNLTSTFDNNNQPLPYHAPSIYPYWDTLDPSRGGTIRYGTVGSSGNKRFIVTWEGVSYTNNASFNPPVTFQIVLYQNGDIRFRFGENAIGGGSNSNGNNNGKGQGNSQYGATIGVQEDGSHYDQYSYEATIDPTKDVLYSLIKQVELKKSSCVLDDPINNTNPKRIPGATIRYAVEVTNRSASMTNVIVEDDLDSLFDTNTIKQLQIQNGTCDCLGVTSANNNGSSGSSAGVNPVRLDFGTISSGTIQNPKIKCGYFEVKLK